VSEWEEFTAYAGIIADAKREERERIIKLLEERHHGEPLEDCCNLNCKNCPHVRCYTCMEEYPCFFVNDIALIKGENK
jgi:hypothetical protein